jgi:hypothetical protein
VDSEMVISVGVYQTLRILGRVSSAQSIFELHGVRVFRMAQRLRYIKAPTKRLSEKVIRLSFFF